MKVILTWLLLLLPVLVIAAVVWNYRRQAAARDAASAERMKAFLGQSNVDAILTQYSRSACCRL